MTSTFNTNNDTQNNNETITLSYDQPTVLDFGLADIAGMKMVDGMLVVTFTDQQTLTVTNFEDAIANSGYQDIKLSDGEIINLEKLAMGLSSETDNSLQVASLDEAVLLDELAPAAGNEFTTLVAKPAADTNTQNLAFELNEGQVYNTNFTREDIQSTALNEQGHLVITFNDGTTTTIENYASFENAADVPQMTLADGTVIAVTEILTVLGEPIEEEDVIALEEPVEVPVQQIVAPREPEVDEVALMTPEQLAAIEVAAGDAAGALGNTGAGFGSSVSNIGLGQLNDEGPIGPTALQFGLPELREDDRFITEAPVSPPSVSFDDARGFEDRAINFEINAAPSVADGSQYITVQVAGIPDGWMPVNTDTTTANGVFDEANGTWTIILSPGETLNDAPIFTPPLNSDEDIDALDVTVTQRDTATNAVTGTATGTTEVIVDAVADPTDLTADDVSGFEDNPVALDIQTALQDLDGSEEITGVTISGIPDGFTLNAGTNNGGGVWSVPASSLPTLELTPIDNYAGTLNLEVTVTNEEVNLSDTEFDFTNNTNVNSATFDVTFTAVADAPSLVVDNVLVKEDNSVFMPIEASLQDTDGSETLTITVTNIDTSWTVETGPNNGTYNAATGTWTITLPAGQNYDGGLQFTPPADSDIDMSNINVTATSNEESNGSSSSVTGIVDIIVDAVADTPLIDAGNDKGVRAGESVAINISNQLTDTDGSESLGPVTIAGVPDGYTLSAGTNQGNGEWTVPQDELDGLMLNTPVDGEGQIELTASVTSTEAENDPENEFDTTDNTATNSDSVVVTVSPDVDPPLVSFGPNGNGTGQVLEDNSQFVPITASLQGDTPQQLTVTLTGVPSTWTVTTGANNGTYSNGTWTITLPEGQNYDGGLTFTPPADSDVDLTGLTITASAENTVNNTTLTSETDGQVIVDAVADTPTIDAGDDASVTSGGSVAINVSNALTDTDGSEELGPVTVSGVPNGYSLNAGTDNGDGTWTVAQSDLSNLRLNTPASGAGEVTLTVSVTSTEQITDEEFNLDNNTATNSDTVTVTVNPPLTPPEVTFGANGSGEAQVLEDRSVFVPITASLTGNAPNQQLTVELTGVPSTWTVNTGANNGTYSNGTWTITLPAGQDYDGGLTFAPPADSDVDLTGLTVTATSTNTNTNEVETASTDGQVIVDAVADLPVLNVNNANGQEGQSIPLTISTGLRDTDGSEELSVVTISGVPNGFSLSAGSNEGNGVWTVTQAQLNGLRLNTPDSFSGSVPLEVSVTSIEQVTDTDFNFNNNEATNTKTLNVVVADTANPPTLEVAGTHRVLEDNSVFVPFEATLNGNGEEVLTVSVTGIPSDWTVETGPNNGTYNSSNGTWSITLPAGQDYDGGLRFAPPTNSDIDLNNIRVKANAFSPETNTNSSITELVDILVDAVADTPTIDAGSNDSVTAGQSVELDITNRLTDRDGSEELGPVTISGIPNGYSLSAGSRNSDGTWTVQQSQLDGLRLNTPANGNGNVNLTVSVTSTEQISDAGEFNLNNNTATNSDTVRITVNPDNEPPTVKFGDGTAGNGSARVLEDNSVFVPITASLQGDAPQQLTVTVSGIPSSWTITTGANNGSYSNGTWTITLPAGQDYDGGLRFAPPTNSDVDLTGLNVRATSKLVGTNETLSTTTNGSVVVDAVADRPNLSTQNAAGEDGQTVALNIDTSLVDRDGSESLSNVTISGIPSGFTLTAGSNQGGGTWSVPVSRLDDLGIRIPNGANAGTYNLNVSVTSTERVTDIDYISSNNTATNNRVLTLRVSEDDVPVITTPSPKVSYERDLNTPNVISGTISVDYGSDSGEVCIPQNGDFSATGAVAGNRLTSNDVPINVTSSGNTYTGKANGVTIFTLVVNANGSYKFTQYEPIDHSSPTNPNERINLNFDICARDNEGDVTQSTLTVRVQDTGPSAKNDVVTMWSCDWVTRGNVITNSNQDNNGKDSLSVEDPNQISRVAGNNFKDGGDAMAVDGQYGKLYIFKDGSYAYISQQSSPKDNQTERFDYRLVDADGDRSDATLRIDVVEAARTSNRDADYGNQTKFGSNDRNFDEAAYLRSENNENNIYTTSKTDGAMVFGYTANDELSGRQGDDVLLGWTGNDTLYGRDGNDVLMGEFGSNTLHGGDDADIFVIHSSHALNNNVVDRIMDFSLGEGDVLALSDVIVGFNSNSDINDFVRINKKGGDAVIQVDSYGDGKNYYDVAVIKNHGGINISNLDVEKLYEQGHIDVT